MKRKFRLLAAALAAITAMSCTSATVVADKVNTAQKPIVDNDQVTIWVDNDDLQISRENQNEYFHNFVDVCTKGFRTEKEMISEVCRAEFTYNATYFLTLEQLEYFRSNKPGIVTIHYSDNKYADSLPEELKYNKEPGYFRMFAVLSNDIVVEKAYNVETRNHYTVQEFIKEAVEYGDVVLVVFDMEESPYAIDGFDITDCSVGWNTVNGEKYYVRKDGTLATKACTINGRLYKFDKSGICKGKYTGWAKNSKGKVYYKDGVKLKDCWLKVNGKRAYYLKSNGIMAVGDVEFKDGRTYHFEADGKLGRSPLIFAAVETNNAWDFYQQVTVVDSAGNIYWSGVYEDRSKEITFGEDDWYDKLLKNTASSDVNKTVSGKMLKKVGAFLKDAEKYSSFDKKVYEYDDGDDGGTTTIYGIYKDADGKTKFIEICKYGDIYECLDDEYVESFVNSLIHEEEMSSFFGGCAEFNE